MEESRDRERLAFGDVADTYERARPGYPPEAVRWLAGVQPTRVVELGAGTGKLTAPLVQSGHQVIATDPSATMLSRLRAAVPTALPVQGVAEAIPVATSGAGVVVAAQAFHWFDHAAALPEIARVLRTGGVLGVVWNYRDESVPWVRRLSAITVREEQPDRLETLAESGLFAPVEHREFRFWQRIDRQGLVDLVHSRSQVAVLSASERESVLDEVSALYDEYGRGPAGMAMPYRTKCFRAHVTERAKDTRTALDEGLLVDFS